MYVVLAVKKNIKFLVIIYRRALRAHKTTTVSVQTDPLSTKLLKEVSIDVQKDLIQMDDQSVETDGAVTIKKERPGGC